MARHEAGEQPVICHAELSVSLGGVEGRGGGGGSALEMAAPKRRDFHSANINLKNPLWHLVALSGRY